MPTPGKGDRCCLWRGRRYADGKVYIEFCVYELSTFPAFADVVARTQRSRPGPMVWEVGGQERFLGADELRRHGVRLQTVTSLGAKQIRYAQVAAAWNRGDIVVPAFHQISQQQSLQDAIDGGQRNFVRRRQGTRRQPIGPLRPLHGTDQQHQGANVVHQPPRGVGCSPGGDAFLQPLSAYEGSLHGRGWVLASTQGQ